MGRSSITTTLDLYGHLYPGDMDRYADHFFCWVYDFNGDGRRDIFVVGFPLLPSSLFMACYLV